MRTKARCRELRVVSLEKLRLTHEGRHQLGVKIRLTRAQIIECRCVWGGGGEVDEKVDNCHSSWKTIVFGGFL